MGRVYFDEKCSHEQISEFRPNNDMKYRYVKRECVKV